VREGLSARILRSDLYAPATHLLNLVLLEVWNPVDDHPRQGAAKVDELVHDEAHDTSGEDVVADVCVPGSPHALEVVEVDIVL
jgi:hypothetical protein